MIKILSFGGGVQSSTILFMAIHGELPKPDHAIFADVGWEPKEVYDWIAYVRPLAEAAGIPLHVVSAGNLREHVMEAVKTGKRTSSPPFYTIGADSKPAIINRSCTSNFKIAPIEKKSKELMGHKPGARLPKECKIEQWIGISADEIQRMKYSIKPWFRFWHPLIEKEYSSGPVNFATFRDVPMTRDDCLAWMKAKAEAATPGPWYFDEDGLHAQLYDEEIEPDFFLDDVPYALLLHQPNVLGQDQFEANADFIAAANPAAILALLDRLKAAEARLAGIDVADNQRWANMCERVKASEKWSGEYAHKLNMLRDILMQAEDTGLNRLLLANIDAPTASGSVSEASEAGQESAG